MRESVCRIARELFVGAASLITLASHLFHSRFANKSRHFFYAKKKKKIAAENKKKYCYQQFLSIYKHALCIIIIIYSRQRKFGDKREREKRGVYICINNSSVSKGSGGTWHVEPRAYIRTYVYTQRPRSNYQLNPGVSSWGVLRGNCCVAPAIVSRRDWTHCFYFPYFFFVVFCSLQLYQTRAIDEL